MASDAERKLAAILSADVVGYSRLMAEDEGETVRRLGAYRTEITNLVGDHRGRVVDFTGDNFLAEFPTATDAVEAAAEIQRVLKARNAAVPAGRAMEFRIGVHLGEVRVEGERLYGDGVNIAARLEGLADPGGTCISGTVLEQIRRKLELDFDDLGEQTVKNIPDPVHAYRLRERPVEIPAGSSRARRWMVAVVGVAIVVGVVAWWLWPPEGNVTSPGTGPAATSDDQEFTVPGFGGAPLIAVLRFCDLGGDPHVSDGLAEDLITRLSELRMIPVISRNSSFVFDGCAADMKQVSRELGAKYLVEGSVRKAGGRLRVSAQLIDATTEGHVWAETYDREIEDIFAIQDEITRAIIAAMPRALLRFEEEKTAHRDPASFQAWDHVRRAWWVVSEAQSIEGEGGDAILKQVREARRFAERALELDPGLPEALALVSLLYGWEAHIRPVSRSESLARQGAAARRCISLNPAHWICLGAMSFFYEVAGNQRQMVSAAERALEMNPSNVGVCARLAASLSLAGRADDAIAYAERARRLDPKGVGSAYFDALTWAHFAAGRYETAAEWAQRTVDLYPNREVAYRGLAASYAQLGRIEEANAAVRQQLRIDPDLTVSKVRSQNAATDPDFLERWLDGLRKAGLPEG